MDPFESGTYSFVIKIWLEEVDDEGQLLWRGHITHVPSKKRRYLQSLHEFVSFIASYLEEARVDLRRSQPQQCNDLLHSSSFSQSGASEQKHID